MEDEEAGEDEKDEDAKIHDEGKDGEKKGDGEEDDEEGSSDKNSCIGMYFQNGNPGFKSGIIIELLYTMLSEKIFDVLRTQQQLGYYVSCMHTCTRGVSALLFIIESSKYNPLELQERIYAFIEQFSKEILTE